MLGVQVIHLLKIIPFSSRFPGIMASYLCLFFILGFTSTDGKRLQVLNRLDNLYYYPQRFGLMKLTARLIWEQADFSSDRLAYSKNPAAIFSWHAKTRERRFKLTGYAATQDTLEQAQLLEFFNQYKEIVVPMTLEEKFSLMDSQVVRSPKGEVFLEFRPKVPEDGIEQYGLFIDFKNWVVRRLKMHRTGSPKTVVNSLQHTQKLGQWLVTKSRILFERDGDTFEKSTEYFYHKIQSYWLIQKIEQNIRKEAKTVARYTLRLDQFKVN